MKTNFQRERSAVQAAREQGAPPEGTSEKVLAVLQEQAKAKAMAGWKPLTIVQRPPLGDDEMRTLVAGLLVRAREGRR